MDGLIRQRGLVTVGGSGRNARRVAAIATILIALAIVKPWPTGNPIPTRPTSPNQAAAANPGPSDAGEPRATPTPGSGVVEPSPGPDDIICRQGRELVSLVKLATWNVREWLPVEPRPATGPLDPSLAFARLDSGAVRALGVCFDVDSQAQPTLAIRGAWQLTGTAPVHAVPMPLTRLSGAGLGSASSPATAVSAPSALATLYRPAGLAPGAYWPSGRFVLQLEMTDGSGTLRWMGLEIARSAGA